MTYVKVNNQVYQAAISGRMADKEWDGRESKSVTLGADFETADALFCDGAAWSIVQEEMLPVTDASGAPVLDAEGNQTYTAVQTEYDNSAYNIRGDLIVHTNGSCTVKMGRQTDLEDAYELLYGGM